MIKGKKKAADWWSHQRIGREIHRKYFCEEIDVFCCNIFCVLSAEWAESAALQGTSVWIWMLMSPGSCGEQVPVQAGVPIPQAVQNLPSSLWRGVIIQEFSPSKKTADRKRCEIVALGRRRLLLKWQSNMGTCCSPVCLGWGWDLGQGTWCPAPHTQLTEQLAAITAPAGPVNAPASLWKEKGRAYNAWTEYLVPDNAAEELF